MPNYEFKCDKCENSFSEFLSMKDRDIPLTNECAACGSKSICRVFSSIGIAADTTLTPNSATKGGWNELMKKIKKGVPTRYHQNLDTASSRTGRRWMG